MKFSKQLSEINWSNFETSHGTAEVVGKQLERLASDNHAKAMKASHDLWCGLCHQHAYISSAAAPAFPFLMDAYLQSGDELKVELLDIFLGFAACLTRSKLGQTWETDLLNALVMHSDIFEAAKTSTNEDISGFAGEILLNLNSKA